MSNTWFIGVLVRLLNSRKFITALVVSIISGILFARGIITGEQFIDALIVLASVLALAIAGEDIAAILAEGKKETP